MWPQVAVKHSNNGSTRTYKVKGLTQKSADDAYFELDAEGGSKMTVAAYFEQTYGIKYGPISGVFSCPTHIELQLCEVICSVPIGDHCVLQPGLH